MKKYLGVKVFSAGLVLLFASLMILNGCAKKELVKKEAPLEEQTVAETPEAGTEVKGEKEGLPFEEKIGEEVVKGDSLLAKLREQILDINFEFDQFTLTDKAREKLAKNASLLSKYPDVNILIEGHCDERGTEEYNLALGERRAETAKQYLVTLGINVSRISTISYGEEKPLDPEHNEIAWAKNRRDHFVIVSR